MPDEPDTSASSKHRPICHAFSIGCARSFGSFLGTSFQPTSDPELELLRSRFSRILMRGMEVRFRAAVREGIAQADRGEFREEEEMDARFEQMLRSE